MSERATGDLYQTSTEYRRHTRSLPHEHDNELLVDSFCRSPKSYLPTPKPPAPRLSLAFAVFGTTKKILACIGQSTRAIDYIVQLILLTQASKDVMHSEENKQHSFSVILAYKLIC